MLERTLPAPPPAISMPELVASVAALIALNAVSIDIMLPALPDIGRSFAIANANHTQWLLTVYIITTGLGQLIYGPITDALGRRAVLTGALGIYMIGTLGCVLAPTFDLFLVGRAVQGVGAAAMSVVGLAVVRDLTEGARMAQIMSLVWSVFMVVPIVGPFLGQLIVLIAPWQWIFGVLLIYASAVLAWALLRLPETLAPENRQKLAPRTALSLYWRVLNNRQTFGYVIAATLLNGVLFAYVVCAQPILAEHYQLGAAFPFAFAAIAAAMTVGSLVNSKLVVRFGIQRINLVTALWMIALNALSAVLVLNGVDALWVFMSLLMAMFAVFNMIATNINAMAMQPAGFAAGSAAAVIGAADLAGGSALGAAVGAAYDGTPAPFLIGLTALSIAMLIAIVCTEGRLIPHSQDRSEGDVHA